MKVCGTTFPLLLDRELLYSPREYMVFDKLHVVGLHKADFFLV
jgi:hypothetical protein